MSEAERSRLDEDSDAAGGNTDSVASLLLRFASHGLPRYEFLRKASELLLSCTPARTVEIWLEHGELRYHWRGTAEPTPMFGFENLTNGNRGATPLDASAATSIGALADASGMVLPFTIDEHNKGVLCLCGMPIPAGDEKQLAALERLAQILGIAVSNRRAQAALNERLKELTCVYRLAQLAADSRLSLDDTLQDVVELLPPAWQYPELAVARITLDDRAFTAGSSGHNFAQLTADVRVHGRVRGIVEVAYVEHTPHHKEAKFLAVAPFLPEEQHLLDAVARELGSVIERREMESERTHLQAQLRHADRLATVGELAAGVAHELNEPLANVLGFAQLAVETDDIGPQPRADVGKIINAALYAREVIRKLMLFSRQAPARRATLDLNRTVNEALSMLEPRCSASGVRVDYRQSAEPTTVDGDPAQLVQVFVNLTVNALQAMPDGGLLTVTTARVEGEAVLSLADTGVGIDPKDVERVYEPFFTTKDVGQGTGLGLAVVHGIVQSHGGTIRVDSRLGEGTRFEISLPLTTTTRTHADAQ